MHRSTHNNNNQVTIKLLDALIKELVNIDLFLILMWDIFLLHTVHPRLERARSISFK